jgi:hypothetical protein
MQLESIEKLGKRKLKSEVNRCFRNAEDADSLEWRLLHFTEADFYLRALERKRGRLERILEVGIAVLILAELCLALGEANLQRASVHHDESAFNGLQQASNMTENSLEILNKKIQLELELYYQPSIGVSTVFEMKRYFIDVHNFGRTNITVLGTQAFSKACIFERPLMVPIGQSNHLDEDGIATKVANESGEREIRIYFTTGDVKIYRARVMFEHRPLLTEQGVRIYTPIFEKINLKTELTGFRRACS